MSMTAHLTAARDALADAHPEYTAIDLFAPEPGRVPPFLVLESPTWGTDPDQPLCDPQTTISLPIRLRVVTGTPTGAAIILDNARTALVGPITVTGRSAVLTWERSEFIGLDTDVTIPATNRHPAVGVDTYTLTSQPV